MKYTKKRSWEKTVREVWSDDKEVRYGVVGTVGDLLAAGILTYSDFSRDVWLFIPALGVMQKARVGKTREEALANLLNVAKQM